MKLSYSLYSWLTIFLVISIGSCSENKNLPCAGGCPVGQVCDRESDQCLDMRPPAAPPDVGRYTTLAVSSSGNVLVGAYAARYGDLVLGRTRDDGEMEYEYVDGLPDPDDPGFRDGPIGQLLPGPDVGLYASLKLDVLGRPNLAYFDRSAGKLKFALKAGTGWMVQTVPAASEAQPVGRAASLALNAEGRIQIAFLDEGLAAVMLATSHDGLEWTVEQVSSCVSEGQPIKPLAGELGRVISLVLDQKERPWIAFHDPWCGGLHLASRSTDGWSLLELDPHAGAGTWLSAALDGNGNVAVAYHQRQSGVLKYASNQGGAMKTVVVDPGTRSDAAGVERSFPAGQHCALSFGHDRLPRIVYLDAERLRLKLALGSGNDSFSAPVEMDMRSPVGFFNALVLGPDDFRVASWHMERDDEGLSAGQVVLYRLDSGANRLRGGP